MAFRISYIIFLRFSLLYPKLDYWKFAYVVTIYTQQSTSNSFSDCSLLCLKYPPCKSLWGSLWHFGFVYGEIHNLSINVQSTWLNLNFSKFELFHQKTSPCPPTFSVFLTHYIHTSGNPASTILRLYTWNFTPFPTC